MTGDDYAAAAAPAALGIRPDTSCPAIIHAFYASHAGCKGLGCFHTQTARVPYRQRLTHVLDFGPWGLDDQALMMG